MPLMYLVRAGLNRVVVDRWDGEDRKLPWGAFGAHYLGRVVALGGRNCQARGETLSVQQNARGTGNIHIWFDTEPELGGAMV